MKFNCMALKYILNFIKQIPRKIRYGNAYKLSLRSKIEIGANIKLLNNGMLNIGNYVTVRGGSEVFSNGGCIDLKGDNYINRNCCIVSHKSIKIGRGTTIGPNTVLYDHDHDLSNKGKFVCSEIEIGENVWIGAGCIILKGVRIGSNSVIGAGTLVNKDVPANCIFYNRRYSEISTRETND